MSNVAEDLLGLYTVLSPLTSCSWLSTKVNNGTVVQMSHFQDLLKMHEIIFEKSNAIGSTF